MSETDDTDVLLLIPPNFFLVQSSDSDNSLLESSRTVVHKPTSCTAQVLDKLVSHVRSLESRLDNLEINTTSEVSSTRTPRRRKISESDSFDNCALERKYFTFPRRRRRKFANNNRDLSLTSLNSRCTNDKQIPPLKLTTASAVTDTLSMDGDISSITSTPSNRNDKLLINEMDEFLNKVEEYESPETKQRNHDSLSPENVIKATGDYISQKLDSKNLTKEALSGGKPVSNPILDKYIYLVKSNSGSTSEKSALSPHTAYQPDIAKGESSYNKPKSPSIRRLSYPDNKDVQPTSTPKQAIKPIPSCMDSFQPSSSKIYERATRVLEQYKTQSYNNTQNTSDKYSIRKEEFKLPEMRPFVDKDKVKSMQNKLIDSIDTDLLSLSELWGEKGDRDKVDSVKLEEERLKREHCEAMIQQLQRKILEQQEKIAVAIKVDRAKDVAISKLKEAWLRLTGSLERAEERHRSALDRMVTEVENFKTVADDAQKKTNHFERELYKTLDLAHDYQEKCKQLTNEKKELKEQTDKLIADKESIVQSREKDIEVLKENYETVMRLNKQSTDCVKNLEDTLQKEKKENEILKSKLSELSRKIQSGNEEMSLMRQERELLKDKVNEERSRCNVMDRQLTEKQHQYGELLGKCDTLESEIKSLRKQLELQKNELKCHYQKQLEDAVVCKLHEFQLQLEQAERDLQHDARDKEAGLVESYAKQIATLQEQHKLEVNVLEEKHKEEMKLYRLQLAQAGEKISLLEGKVESYRRRRTQMASQLHAVMEAQWRKALCILTGPQQPVNASLHSDRTEWSPAAQDYAPPRVPPLAGPPLGSMGVAEPEGRPLGGVLGADMFNFESLSDNELQQYVKLLLTKPPKMDGSGDCSNEQSRDVNEHPTSDRPEKPERDRNLKRTISANKPPWKS